MLRTKEVGRGTAFIRINPADKEIRLENAIALVPMVESGNGEIPSQMHLRWDRPLTQVQERSLGVQEIEFRLSGFKGKGFLVTNDPFTLASTGDVSGYQESKSTS